MEKENNNQNSIKCPKSGCNDDLRKTDGLQGITGNMGKDGSYDSPSIPIYECQKCKNIFTEDELSQ